MGVTFDQVPTILSEVGLGPLGPARRRIHVAFTGGRCYGSVLGHGGKFASRSIVE